jgi:transposase
MQCFRCEKINGKSRKEMQTICGHCREVLKADLVMAVLELDPIYLSEANRHKSGRPPKLNADRRHEARQRRKNGESYGKIAKDMKISKTTIYNATKDV